MMSVPRPGADTHMAQSSTSLEFPPMDRRRGRARGLLAVYQSYASALEALRANVLRSLLTSLGIIIGVSAVVMVIASGEGNSGNINQRLSGLSPNELVIRSGSARGFGVWQGAGTRKTLTQAVALAITAPDTTA